MIKFENAHVDCDRYLIGWKGFRVLYTLAWQDYSEWAVLTEPASPEIKGSGYRVTVFQAGRLALFREAPVTDRARRGFSQISRITL